MGKLKPHSPTFTTSRIIDRIDLILTTHLIENTWQAFMTSDNLNNGDNEMAQSGNKQLRPSDPNVLKHLHTPYTAQQWWKQKPRFPGIHTHIHRYIDTHTHIYIYIYIYMCVKQLTEYDGITTSDTKSIGKLDTFDSMMVIINWVTNISSRSPYLNGSVEYIQPHTLYRR